MKKKSEESKKKRVVASALIFFLFCLAVLSAENKIFGYKDKEEWSTDRRISQYRELKENTIDVLIVGSSHMMSGIAAPLLWEKSGISAYNYVSRNQTVPFTYLSLKEALKTQKPKLIIFDISILINPSDYYGLVYDEYHAHINLDTLPLSAEKIKLMSEYLPVKEQINYYLPFLRFHTRWKELSGYDFGRRNGQDGEYPIYNGFCIVKDVWEKEIVTQELPVNLSERWQAYFQKMMELCKEKGIEVLFLDIPNGQNITWEGMPYAYLNGNQLEEEIGYQEKTDARDETHMNVFGAIKFTNYLNEYLKQNYELSDHRGEAGYEQMEEICQSFREEMQEQGITK